MSSVVRLIICAFSVFFLSPSARAGQITVDPTLGTAAAIMPDAIVNKDLAPRAFTLHPSAGYFTGTSIVDSAGATTSVHGFGGTIEAQSALSQHFGVIYSLLGFSGSGTYTPGSSEIGASSGSCSISGWVAGAAFVLDPFSGNGFRLPIFIGLNYENLSSSTPSSPIITSLSLTSTGFTFGISPRFNLGPLRLEPFLVTMTPFSQGNVTCAADIVAGACGALSVSMLPVLGVNVEFRPWNFSFYLNAANFLFGTGISFYSFGPQFTF